MAWRDTVKILLVEDHDQELRETKEDLEQSGFIVDAARSAEEALSYARSYHYNAVIMDLHLTSSTKEMDGLNLISEIRRLRRPEGMDVEQRKPPPFLVLTQRTDMEAELNVFAVGGKEFISKRYFRLPVLVARLNRIIMDSEGIEYDEGGILRHGPISLDLLNAEVRVHDEKIKFKRQEFRFLKYLMITKQRAVPTRELVNQLWDSDKGADSSNVYNLVTRVRKLLVPATKRNPILHVETIPGYRLLDLTTEQ